MSVTQSENWQPKRQNVEQYTKETDKTIQTPKLVGQAML